jgi:hypothetical protein
MKRTYFPGIIDIVVVTDPAEIRTISNDSRFDRDFIGHGPVHNVQRLRTMLRIFSLNGRLFPTMLPRTNPSRAAAQGELWSRRHCHIWQEEPTSPHFADLLSHCIY